MAVLVKATYQPAQKWTTLICKDLQMADGIGEIF